MSTPNAKIFRDDSGWWAGREFLPLAFPGADSEHPEECQMTAGVKSIHTEDTKMSQ